MELSKTIKKAPPVYEMIEFLRKSRAFTSVNPRARERIMRIACLRKKRVNLFSKVKEIKAEVDKVNEEMAEMRESIRLSAEKCNYYAENDIEMPIEENDAVSLVCEINKEKCEHIDHVHDTCFYELKRIGLEISRTEAEIDQTVEDLRKLSKSEELVQYKKDSEILFATLINHYG